ncbi:hypothetical protein FPOAC2_10672 [Fusarium poae]
MGQFHRQQSVCHFDNGREFQNVIARNVKDHFKNYIKDRVQQAKDAFKDAKRLLPREKKKERDKRDKNVSEFVGNTDNRDDHHDSDDYAWGH